MSQNQFKSELWPLLLKIDTNRFCFSEFWLRWGDIRHQVVPYNLYQ